MLQWAHHARTHDTSCEKISLEVLSNPIYYCEDIGCLGGGGATAKNTQASN